MNSCRDWVFSNSGLEVWLPAFQLPMFAKRDTAWRRFARHVCLRHPFPPFHFGIPSIQSLPEAGSWERQYAPPVLHYACIMLRKRSYPFVEDSGFVSQCREAKVWSRSCGLQGLLPAAHVRQMWRTAETRFFRSSCLRNPWPFVKSKCPLPNRSLRSLRAAAHSIYTSLETCLTQRSRGFGHGVVVSRICWGIFPISDGSMWPLQNNE